MRILKVFIISTFSVSLDFQLVIKVFRKKINRSFFRFQLSNRLFLEGDLCDIETSSLITLQINVSVSI